MLNSLRHVGIVVSNLDASINFWESTFEFNIVNRVKENGPVIDKVLGLQDVDLETAKLIGPDNFLLELLCFNSHPDKEKWIGEPYSTGITHIAFNVKNLDAVYEKLNVNKLVFANKPQISVDGRVKVIYARCPDGVFLELVEEL